jgi:hypothetical protein
VRVEVEGKLVYKDTIMDFQIVGPQAEYVDKYLRGHYNGNEEGKKENGFKARKVSVTWYLEQYSGTVYNDTEIRIQLPNGDIISYDAGHLPITTTKTRMRIVDVDALDFVEKNDVPEKKETPSNVITGGKVISDKNTNKRNKATPNDDDDENYEEIMVTLDDDEMPF